MGFITYHVYPAAPPWYFHTHGCVVDVLARSSEGPNLARVDALLGVHYFQGLYGRSNDVFGAVPSLHVAYPLVVVLDGWRLFGRFGKIFTTSFWAVMCFAAVYLDHHWVIDVILGLIYALGAFSFVRWVSTRRGGTGARDHRHASRGLTSDALHVPDVARRYVRWVLAHGRTIWIAALLLALPATWRTVTMYAHLRSELEQLLPRDAKSVRAIDELRARMPGLQYLGVIVDTARGEHVPAGEKFLDDVAARVRAYPPELVRGVRLGNLEEKSFLEKNAALYMDLEDLQKVRARIEARRDWEVAHKTGTSLEDDDDATAGDAGNAPPLDFSDLEQKYKERAGTGRTFPTGRFSDPGLHLTLMLIEVGGFETARGRSEELFARVKSDVAAIGIPPGMRVGYTGDIAIAVEETSALMEDLSFSSIVVLVLVAAVLILYYRWWRSLFVLVPPLLLAAVYSFGVASLPPFGVSELNSNTAFLASIIVGNGVNFGIILLARYVEERRAGMPLEESLARAVWASRPGTLSAALAAGVSYASLALTDFRGFRQFGCIAASGW
jgi:hypothetical protein